MSREFDDRLARYEGTLMTPEQHDRLMREEWDAWQVVMDYLQDDLGVTLAAFNSRGRRIVAALDGWAERRAALLAFNARVRAQATVDVAEQKGSDNAR